MVLTAQNINQKPGYKQTEVGIVPEDWEVKLLGEIASVSSGGTPDRLNPTYWGGDVPLVTTTQINFNLIDKANEFITRKGLENSAARVYNPGTLLMLERHHNDRFIAYMSSFMPLWQHYREELNRAPLGHEAWEY